MKRFVLMFLAALSLFVPQARAQMAVRVDTAALRAPAFDAKELITPGVLVATGVGIHCFAHQAIDVPVNDWFQQKWRAGGPERNFDNYIQYIPIVMDLGLGLVGARAEHGFVDRLIEGSLGCLSLG
ncbi:MAG: hypothetical protein ACSW8J_10760, partial [bacterium]